VKSIGGRKKRPRAKGPINRTCMPHEALETRKDGTRASEQIQRAKKGKYSRKKGKRDSRKIQLTVSISFTHRTSVLKCFKGGKEKRHA